MSSSPTCLLSSEEHPQHPSLTRSLCHAMQSLKEMHIWPASVAQWLMSTCEPGGHG